MHVPLIRRRPAFLCAIAVFLCSLVFPLTAQETGPDADASAEASASEGLPAEGLPAEGQERFDALQERARAAREEGRTREALQLYGLMQEMAPEDADIAYNRASLHLDLREYERAVILFQRAGEMGLDTAEFHYNRGNALYGAGRIEPALGAYEAALEREPEDADTLNNLGLASLAMDDVEAAREYLERAAAADTQWAVPFFHLGNLHLDQDEPEAAASAFTEALNRNTAFDQAQYNRGIAYYRSGAFRDAFDDFLAVRELRPEDPDVLYNLGASAVAAAEALEADNGSTSGESDDASDDAEGGGDGAE